MTISAGRIHIWLIPYCGTAGFGKGDRLERFLILIESLDTTDSVFTKVFIIPVVKRKSKTVAMLFTSKLVWCGHIRKLIAA